MPSDPNPPETARTPDPTAPRPSRAADGETVSAPANAGASVGDTADPDAHTDLLEDVRAVLAPPEQPGELGRLGRYRVLRVLGRGGMGVVFAAEDEKLKRLVALKAMLPGLAASASARKRFVREAETAAKVEHDHIVPIYDIAESNGVPFIAMPLLVGHTLADRLKAGEPLPVGDVLVIGRHVADGLAAAHAAGLIHRDIKPANVWLEMKVALKAEGGPAEAVGERTDEDRTNPAADSSVAYPLPSSAAFPSSPPALAGVFRRARILDFGLARSLRDAGLITASGAVMGTPAYMAPEQARGLAVDHRADLFSLGIVLYQMTTGKRPFRGDDTFAVLTALATDTPPAPAALNPAVPPALSALIERLLAKEPGDRWPPTAQAVADELARLTDHPLPAPVPVFVPPTLPAPPVEDRTADLTEVLAPRAAPAPRAARRGCRGRAGRARRRRVRRDARPQARADDRTHARRGRRAAEEAGRPEAGAEGRAEARGRRRTPEGARVDSPERRGGAGFSRWRVARTQARRGVAGRTDSRPRCETARRRGRQRHHRREPAGADRRPVTGSGAGPERHRRFRRGAGEARRVPRTRRAGLSLPRRNGRLRLRPLATQPVSAPAKPVPEPHAGDERRVEAPGTANRTGEPGAGQREGDEGRGRATGGGAAELPRRVPGRRRRADRGPRRAGSGAAHRRAAEDAPVAPRHRGRVRGPAARLEGMVDQGAGRRRARRAAGRTAGRVGRRAGFHQRGPAQTGRAAADSQRTETERLGGDRRGASAPPHDSQCGERGPDRSDRNRGHQSRCREARGGDAELPHRVHRRRDRAEAAGAAEARSVQRRAAEGIGVGARRRRPGHRRRQRSDPGLRPRRGLAARRARPDDRLAERHSGRRRRGPREPTRRSADRRVPVPVGHGRRRRGAGRGRATPRRARPLSDQDEGHPEGDRQVGRRAAGRAHRVRRRRDRAEGGDPGAAGGGGRGTRPRRESSTRLPRRDGDGQAGRSPPARPVRAQAGVAHPRERTAPVRLGAPRGATPARRHCQPVRPRRHRRGARTGRYVPVGGRCRFPEPERRGRHRRRAESVDRVRAHSDAEPGQLATGDRGRAGGTQGPPPAHRCGARQHRGDRRRAGRPPRLAAAHRSDARQHRGHGGRAEASARPEAAYAHAGPQPAGRGRERRTPRHAHRVGRAEPQPHRGHRRRRDQTR